MHVDCCLGGFIVPFIDSPKINFDFTIDGVTSISCDHHKYGLAPKGISVIMYKSRQLMHSAYFSYHDWSGGLYSTPTLSGSRSGMPIVGAWLSIMHNGI